MYRQCLCCSLSLKVRKHLQQLAKNSQQTNHPKIMSIPAAFRRGCSTADACAFCRRASSRSHAQELNATHETKRWAQPFLPDPMRLATLFAARLSRDGRPIDPDSHCGWRRMPVSACHHHYQRSQFRRVSFPFTDSRVKLFSTARSRSCFNASVKLDARTISNSFNFIDGMLSVKVCNCC